MLHIGKKERNASHSRTHYEANKEAMKARAKQHNQTQNEVLRGVAYEYLLEHPCVDCGERDPVVLQFDHRDGVEKLGTISHMISKAVGMRTLVDEIAKCDVRCANCHQRRTAHKFGYYTTGGGKSRYRG